MIYCQEFNIKTLFLFLTWILCVTNYFEGLLDKILLRVVYIWGDTLTHILHILYSSIYTLDIFVLRRKADPSSSLP